MKKNKDGIYKRYSVTGVGYYFREAKDFTNIIIISCSNFYKIINFDYKGKEHKIRLVEGRYGEYFSFRGSTYYVF